MRFVRDHYEVLGVSPRASVEEIRSAHRIRAVWDHRKGVLGVQAELEKLREAHDVLTDPEQRRAFDRLRNAFLVVPRRESIAEENAKLRREGRLRRNYARRLAADARRMSERSVARSDHLVQQLTATASASALPERSHGWRRLGLLGVCFAVSCGLVLLYLLQRS